MQTLIKWPGGKSREFIYIKDLVPKFDRYIEPFFGGGAVFFNLEPKKSIINDICVELMDFYRFVKEEFNRNQFKIEMYKYVDNWEKIPKFIKLFENKLINLYIDFSRSKIGPNELRVIVTKYLQDKEKQFNGLFAPSFCVDDKNLLRQIITNLISKMQRMKQLEKSKGKLSKSDLGKNIETAFRSGFYMHFRDIMNMALSYKINNAKKIANYYFVREFCYGSMFRFNSQGEFNIPYGGIAYNTKDYRKKVDYIFSKEILNLFKNSIILNKDFEKIFNQYKYSKKDFIFLDPPYDTDFSDYEKKSFDKKDQARLASCLYKTKANFILIIKNTPFIYNLYNNKKGIKIERFKKKYLYNVKGRNKRNVEHLIIYNFKPKI